MDGPLFFPAHTRSERRALSQAKASGAITMIGPRLYIRSDVKDRERVVRSHWPQIVSALFPDALISHRTALEYAPTRDGDIFLTSSTNRTVEYPGLRLRFHRGPAALSDDVKFLGARASSLPRAFLENLSVTRGTPKNISIEQVELRLEKVLADAGESGLNRLRDRAREIANELGWSKELARLDNLILGTRRDAMLTSKLARARAAGAPFDERCIERLQILFAELRGRVFEKRTDTRGFAEHFRNKAFFEAYFSNYIEGTTFEVPEAERIVFDHEIPARRPQDAHDIASTFRIVSDPIEMRRIPESYEALRELLIGRHSQLMKERPEIGPGQFKQERNRAGDTVFVHPDYVEGTLQRGAELLVDLEPGLRRAVFVMVLVTEVHPFNDGNGRMARVMMNAELVATTSTTIIIPTSYRDDYVDTLRALTRQSRPTPIVDMLVRAQRFSDLDFTDYALVKKQLEANNWFKEPSSGFKLIF